MKRINIIHPFLFALFPLLFLFSKNAEEVQVLQTLIPAIALIIFSCVLLVCYSLIFNRDIVKGAIFTSVFLLLFFSADALYVLLDKNQQVFIMRKRYIDFAFLLILFIVFILLRRDKKFSIRIAGILNVISLSLVLFNIAIIFYVKSTAANSIDRNEETNLSDSLPHAGYKPDIYYFILDEYAREDILKKIHGLDNSRFTLELRKRGFYVADSSHSNYALTQQSLASLFNFQYLGEEENFSLERTMIQNSKAFSLLKKSGYKIIAFPTGMEFTELKNADNYISYPFTPNEISIQLVGMTPLKELFINIGTIMRKEILFPLQNIQRMKITETPKVVFVHLLCPHPPFVFGQNGEAIEVKNSRLDFKGEYIQKYGGSFSEYSLGYRNQLIYLNKIMLETIDSIFSHSSQPPIIIIHGDHGSKMLANYSAFEDNYFTEQFSNLCTVYFPGGADSALYQSITPVNIFRILFNQYYQSNYELLPDKCYFENKEGKFVMVNELMNAEAEKEKKNPLPTPWLKDIGSDKF